jgi:hypothetical protein
LEGYSAASVLAGREWSGRRHQVRHSRPRRVMQNLSFIVICDGTIDEVLRVGKDELGRSGCQARSEQAQRHHSSCCLVAFCVLERERHARGLTIYKFKRQLSFKGCSVVLPVLEQLRSAA